MIARFWIFVLLLLSGAAKAHQIAAVEFGAESVNLNIPLYKSDEPESFLTGATFETAGLAFTVITDRSSGNVGLFRQSDSTLEACSAQGTYSTPTATKARFCETSATGIYQLQLPNSIFASSDATRLDIKVSGGNALDSHFWVDLTAQTQADLVAAILNADCSSYSTQNAVGYQLCTMVNAIFQSVGSTLDAKINTISARTANITLFSGQIETVTSQVALIHDPDSAPEHDGSYVGDEMCVTSENSGETHCSPILSYTAATGEYVIRANRIPFTIAEGDNYYIRAAGANTEGMNAAPVCGNGQPGTPWTGC